MKFLVVVPTIRQGLPGYEEAISAIESSFTRPTEFHVLDGHAGKTQTLNRAFDEVLSPSDCDIYVTVDDDYIPGKDWQGTVERAFEASPKLGAVALWLGDSDEMLSYVGAQLIEAPTTVNGTTYRKLKKGHHIAGCMIAFRKTVMMQVGKTPETSEKYQIWEDCWRGRRVQVLGYDLAYVEGDLPKMLHYNDPDSYVRSKEADILTSRRNQAENLRKGGIREPFVTQLRRVVARLRGRAKEN